MLFVKYIRKYLEAKQIEKQNKEQEKIEKKNKKLLKKLKEHFDTEYSACHFANKWMENSDSNWGKNDSNDKLYKVEKRYEAATNIAKEIKLTKLKILNITKKELELKKEKKNLKQRIKKLKTKLKKVCDD